MFHSAYRQGSRGEFIELVYTPGSVNVDVDIPSKQIPNELKNETTSQIIATFFEPPVNTLISVMVLTFSIYLAASFLYVSHIQFT